MIPLLGMKTAETAHMGIFGSVTRPFSNFLGGAGDKAINDYFYRLIFIVISGVVILHIARLHPRERYNHSLLPRQHHCRDMNNIFRCCLGNRLYHVHVFKAVNENFSEAVIQLCSYKK